MNNVQQTVYGLKSIIYMLFGIQPEINASSTANERLAILPNERPTANERVRMGVLMVGNKGHRQVPGTGGISKTSINDHMANHASLYNPMPFCMRPVDNDIPLAQRNKYALRKEIPVDGQNYYAYYGYRLNIAPGDIQVSMLQVTTENGQEIVEPFVPDNDDLFPDPLNLPTTGAVTTSDVKLKARAILQVKFTQLDIEEYVNAAKVLYAGDEGYAIMSEFGLCTNADRQVTVSSSGGSIPFLEAIGCQIYNFSFDHRPVFYNSQELTIEFDVGNLIPLLSTASIPTIQTIG